MPCTPCSLRADITVIAGASRRARLASACSCQVSSVRDCSSSAFPSTSGLRHVGGRRLVPCQRAHPTLVLAHAPRGLALLALLARPIDRTMALHRTRECTISSAGRPSAPHRHESSQRIAEIRAVLRHTAGAPVHARQAALSHGLEPVRHHQRASCSSRYAQSVRSWRVKVDPTTCCCVAFRYLVGAHSADELPRTVSGSHARGTCSSRAAALRAGRTTWLVLTFPGVHEESGGPGVRRTSACIAALSGNARRDREIGLPQFIAASACTTRRPSHAARSCGSASSWGAHRP